MSLSRQDVMNQLKTYKVDLKNKTKKQITDEYKNKLKPYLETKKQLGELISDTIMYKTIDTKGHIVMQKRKIDEIKGVLDDIKTYLIQLKVVK